MDDDGRPRARRKEVGLGRLKRLAILVTLGAWSPAAFAEPPAPDAGQSTPAPVASAEKAAAPAPAASPRKEPPASPREYLETGASLFNKGRYELASKYFQAARRYRDRLSESEQIVLDVYTEKLEEYRRESQAPKPAIPMPIAAGARKAAARDGGVIPASAPMNVANELTRNAQNSTAMDIAAMPNLGSTSVGPADQPAAAAPRVGLERGPVYGTHTWRDSATSKEKARWLMQYAREQIYKSHFDVAERAINEARTMKVEWTLFDETPDNMSEALEKAKAKKKLALASSPDLAHDRKTAKMRLREARNALAASEYDRAEAIARDVKSWNLGYTFFDDTPDKVAHAIVTTRNRRLGQTAAPDNLIFHADSKNAAALDSTVNPR